MIVTDHKPLVKNFGDRTLDEITKSRLFRLKQRTLPWRFEIRHLPGKSNHAADAASRHPSPSCTENTVSLGSPSFPDIAESALINTIRNDAHELGAIPWSLLATETAADASLGPLLTSVEQRKPITSDDPTLTGLRPICESLYAAEGVLLYQDHVVVPPVPTPSSLTEPARSPSRNLFNGTTSPAPSSTGQGCHRISATLGRAAQTVTEMHPHR